VASDPRHLDDAQNSAPTGRTADLLRSASGIIPEFQTDFGDEVVRALQRIGDVPRACLLLRTVHELSYFEISELLHIPEGTAMSHVHRTRRSMREMLREHVEPAAGKDDSR
jgi:RNA polymerase sigma-70 factor (ECF subfamily)